jgi:hypothetical protein
MEIVCQCVLRCQRHEAKIHRSFKPEKKNETKCFNGMKMQESIINSQREKYKIK